MPVTPLSSRAVILVKALSQPSKRYGETVCCDGITIDRKWKRLYPVRFRHLHGDQSFSRWEWVTFKYNPPKPKSRAEIKEEREAYQPAARQDSFFDEPLPTLEPSPYDFRFAFEDESGKHDYQNGDWEAHAMFWRERNHTSEEHALKWMHEKFNDEFPRRGMVFAIGNQAKRPQTWQLLGVIRLDKMRQGELSV